MKRMCSRSYSSAMSGCFSRRCAKDFSTRSSSFSPRMIWPHGQARVVFMAVLRESSIDVTRPYPRPVARPLSLDGEACDLLGLDKRCGLGTVVLMDLERARDFIREHHEAIMLTYRRDGSPQLSPVACNV